MDEHVRVTDIGWSDYVVSHFDEKTELWDGHPNVSGLRRVAELILGPIDESIVVNYSPVDSHGRATVHYAVRFLSGQRVSDVADASPSNIDPKFAPYAMATAVTRAEARCLRKALKLRVCSAEEIGGEITQSYTSVINNSDDKITADQLSFITSKCKKLNININKLISKRGNYTSLVSLEKEVAKNLVKDLSMWSNDKSLIDSSILGYEE